MRLGAIALFAVVALAGSDASAINKCTSPDGKVSFQDAPCVGGKSESIAVKPVPARRISAAHEGSAPSSTEAARIQAFIAASQRDRRAQDLRDRLLPEAERALTDHRRACEKKAQELTDEQSKVQGKTHALQIASELAANAGTCDMKDRELKETVDTLLKECHELHCRS